MSETSNQFKIGLCEVGECESCLFSYCCSCCALAQARSFVDSSPPIFNFCCITQVTERWLIRSAYQIPGDACSDCYTTSFCPCCVANQAYQTAKDFGNPVTNGGRFANVHPFTTRLPPPEASVQEYAYSFCCTPCAIGNIMERSVGMPWYLGCCCVNVVSARNIMRYQYRLKGDDVMEELVAPCCAHIGTHMAAQVCPCAGCFLWAAYAAVTTQMSLESQGHAPSTVPYLSESHAPSLPPGGSGVVITPVAMIEQPTQQQVQIGKIEQYPPSAVQIHASQPAVASNPNVNWENKKSY